MLALGSKINGQERYLAGSPRGKGDPSPAELTSAPDLNESQEGDSLPEQPRVPAALGAHGTDSINARDCHCVCAEARNQGRAGETTKLGRDDP